MKNNVSEVKAASIIVVSSKAPEMIFFFNIFKKVILLFNHVTLEKHDIV